MQKNKKVKILLAEDEMIIALDVKVLLRRLGYDNVSIVRTGKELLEKSKSDDPNLIITDIMLADKVSGIDAARSIKEIKNIPILFMAGFSNENFIKDAKSISPEGLIFKPFNVNELKNKMHVLLHE